LRNLITVNELVNMKKKLAILGGIPVRNEPHAPYNTIGSIEKETALGVLNSGVLSGFVATTGAMFL